MTMQAILMCKHANEFSSPLHRDLTINVTMGFVRGFFIKLFKLVVEEFNS